MNILLTGYSGFVGTHFRQAMPCTPLANAAGKPVDLREPEAVAAAVEAARPDAVVHLAAQAFVPESFRDPRATFAVNVMGTLNLLIALRDSGFRGRMIHVSSGDVYGLVPEEALPVREEQPLRPRNPYAASKVAAEALAGQWSRSEGFEIVIVRPFNHTGPGQHPDFVLSNFARQVAAIRLGQQEPVLTVGDIDVTRDFTDVRDIVRAYGLLLRMPEAARDGERGAPVYNVCTGVEVSCRAALETLLAISGLEARVEPARERMRPSEQRRVAGSCEKLHRQTGWRAEIPLERTLADLLTYWERQLQ